jgi:DHA2 family multidrug resistance protein
MPFFFIPTTQLALSSVLPSETASAAGLQNFLRTMAAAVGTSLVTTGWDNAITRNRMDLAGRLNDPNGVAAGLTAHGLSPAQALGQVDLLTQGQAVMRATDQMFLLTTLAFIVSAAVVWFSPKQKAVADMSAAH